MKYMDMEKLTPYRVVTASSDSTFMEDDIIWMTPKGEISCLSVAGWISMNECGPETLDFELEKAKKYEILNSRRGVVGRRTEQGDRALCEN